MTLDRSKHDGTTSDPRPRPGGRCRRAPDSDGTAGSKPRTGGRAVAVLPDGRITDDFRVLRHKSRGRVLNAPSAAATASLAIAEQVVGLALE